MQSARGGAMPEAITAASLASWRCSPISFIEEALRDPDSGTPFVLNDAERAFLALAFTLDDSGRLKFPEMCFGAIKKSGKTTLAPDQLREHGRGDDLGVAQEVSAAQGFLRPVPDDERIAAPGEGA